MKTVIAALRDWLAYNDHPAEKFAPDKPGGLRVTPFKVQIVFLTDGDAMHAKHMLAREISGPDYQFVSAHGHTVLGVPVEFHGPTIRIER